MNEKELTHIDLFSGIGGFTLAAEWAGFKTVVFCEKEKFCQKVLKARFGAVITNSEHMRKLQSERSKQNKRKRTSNFPVLIPEIRDFDGTKYRGATLLTGGFPCQPFSVAGQRRGKEDDRYLWPEMFRVIGEAKPHWILAENVPGIFRMALDTVLADLEGEGYTTGTFIIPACGLNAPHRRNRIWIVGYSSSSGTRKQTKNIYKGNIEEAVRKVGFRDGAYSTNSHASNSRDIKGRTEQKIKLSRKTWTEIGKHRRVSEGVWNKNWLEVATRFCRMDDGVSDRVHRLKALGNAIVPQIAYEIIKNIAWIENERHLP